LYAWYYFKLKQKLKPISDPLRDPDGPLSKEGGISQSSIASANASVHIMMAAGSSKGPYLHLTPAQKLQIRKRASEYGVTKIIDHYKVVFIHLPLKETSVRRFKDSHIALLK